MSDELFAGLLAFLVPMGFAIFVLNSRRRLFARWAKFLAIFGAVAGVISAVLSFVLLHHKELGLTVHARFILLGCKHTLDGIFIGLAISILSAHRSTQRHGELAAQKT
jgi:hypothetical protein